MAVDIEILDRPAWQQYADSIMRLENTTYEASRQDSRQYFSSMVENPRSVCVLALSSQKVVGFCFGGPLEDFAGVHGIRDDAHWGENNTLYSADLTVAPRYQGQRIGLRLKEAQMRWARACGYRYITGRNRVGLADPMWQLNQKLGACQVQVFENSYSDGPEPRDAIYYRIELTETKRGKS